MVQLSIRVVLGALSAVTVAIVAAVTLSITLTSSLDALRRIGKKHADALLAVAEGETTQLFAKGSNTVLQVVNVTESAVRPPPSTSPTTAASLEGALHSAFVRGQPELDRVEVFYRDNSYMGFSIVASDTSFYGSKVDLPQTPYSATAPPFSQIFDTALSQYSSSTHAPLGTTRTTGPLANHRDTFIWPILYTGTGNATTPLIHELQVLWEPDTNGQPVISELLPMVAPIFLPGQSAALGNEAYGYTVITFSAAVLDSFLRRTRSTPGTVAFAYDGLGFIFATSADAPARQLQPLAAVVPPGCGSTAVYPTTMNVTHTLVCRVEVGAFPHDGLKALASSDRASLFPTASAGRSVRRVKASGEVYYAAAVRVALAFPGLEIYLLLLVPEADVLGDVITSRNVAIGVTCALVVVAVAVNVAVVFVMLAPLGGIATRMISAANLEDDGAEEEVSAMSEVAQLQKAYYAMNNELNRIRAYVPQSVLMARKAALEGDDGQEDEEEEEGDLEMDFEASKRSRSTGADRSRRKSRAYSDTRSVGSRRSGSSARSHKISSAGGAVAASAHVAIVTRQVSIIAANLVGLHGVTSVDSLLDEIAAAAEAMDNAVASRRGALTFHGDRFLATFNAASVCAGHAVKAASAAVAAATAFADRSSSQLQLTAGVASGMCTVGPMGSDAVKAMSAVGPAVTTAGLLERLATRGVHGTGCTVLAAHRTASEAATSLVIEYVDLVRTPGTGRPLAVAALTHPSRRRQSTAMQEDSHNVPEDEWMYVMAKEGSPYNVVFEELHRGRVGVALKAFEELRQSAARAGAAAAATTTAEDCPMAKSAAVVEPSRLAQVMEELQGTAGDEERAEALLRAARTVDFTHIN